MVKRTSFGRVFFLPLLLSAMTFSAHAQGETDNFCALDGTDLLAVLDGSWTIHQGVGTVLGFSNMRGLGLQLPPPRPASVIFRYDAKRGIVDVESATQPDGIIMFPAEPAQQDQASQRIGEPPSTNASSSGCDWSALPTLIGTNVYVEWDVHHLAVLLDPRSRTCSSIESHIEEIFGPGPAKVYDDPYMNEIAAKNRANSQRYYNEHCRDREEPLPSGASFDMEMTLIVRFLDANSGSGTLYFEGKTEKAKFRASAPITLTR